jgi:hypothetical protein
MSQAVSGISATKGKQTPERKMIRHRSKILHLVDGLPAHKTTRVKEYVTLSTSN